MKKLTSILCALVIALGAIAAPQLPNRKASQPEKHGFEFAKKIIAEKATSAEKVSVKKATLKQAEATQVTIVDCTAEYISYYGAFVYTLIDENEVEYYFAFPSTGEDVVVSGTTYTLADMSADDSYWIDWNTWDYASFTAVTFLKTEDGNGGVKIVVNATDENGTEFVLTYEFVISGETVEIVPAESVTKPEYYEAEEEGEDGDWYFSGHNAKYEFALDLYGAAESMVGEYSFAKFYSYYCYLYDVENENQISLKDASAVVTAGANDTLHINVEILGNDGVKYVIKAFYAAPSALAQTTITATNLTVEEGTYSAGWNEYPKYTFTASDAQNEIEFSWIDSNETGSFVGTFDVADLSSFTVTPAGKDYTFPFSGSVTIAEADGVITITGTVLCLNNVEYTLNLSGAAPEEQKPVELPEGAEVVEYSMSFTDYYNAAASKPVNVAVVGNQVYFQGMSDALPEAWAVGTLEGTTVTFAAGQLMGEYGSYGEVIFPYGSDAVFTFDAEANTYSATGTVFGAVGNYYDGYYTNPVLSLVVETAATPANPAITALKNGNYGYYIVFSVPTVDVEGNGLLSSKLSFQFFTDIEHDIQPLVFTPATHTYLTEDMTIIPFGFTEDWDFYSTQIYLNELYSADWNKLGIKSIYTGGGETNETEIQWFDIKEYAPATSIDNTNAAAKAVKRIENGQIVIEKNGVRYNVLGAEMK